MGLSKFDNLLYSLADLPPKQRRQAITFAVTLGDFPPEVIRLAAKGAEILYTSDEADKKRRTEWLWSMEHGAKLQQEGKLHDPANTDLYRNNDR